VFENPEQGTNRSTALAILAVDPNWFSDNLPLNVKGKEVIETLRGKWIIEAAELSGMRKTEIEQLKAFLSRQVDRARLSYGRTPAEVPRQCVFVGTTNHEVYLKDTTGNRRYWPVFIVQFDLEALRRDCDQLWAEAAAREASGASIRLDPRLWPVAAVEQAQRTIVDPFYETLKMHLGEYSKGKISSECVWEILDVRGGQRTQDLNARLGKAMRDLDWKRANTAGTVKIEGKNMMGYVKGEEPYEPTIWAHRDRDGLSVYEGDHRPREQGEGNGRVHDGQF
jgi:predicted P-loop ATPase